MRSLQIGDAKQIGTDSFAASGNSATIGTHAAAKVVCADLHDDKLALPLRQADTVISCQSLAVVAIGLLFAAALFAQTDLAGKASDPFQSPASVRVLLFVRTDCPITNRYAPELKRIAAEFQRQPVHFWLVYPDKSETAAAIQQHIETYQLPGTPLHDPRQVLVKRAQAIVSPQAAVFDKAGRLIYSGRIDDRYVDFGKSRPEATVHDLELAISDALSGKAPAQRRTKAIGCYLSDLQ